MAIGAVASGAVRIGSMFARGTGSLLGRGGGMLHKATLKRSKIRRENFVRTKKLNKGLIETRKRREKESMLEGFLSWGEVLVVESLNFPVVVFLEKY